MRAAFIAPWLLISALAQADITTVVVLADEPKRDALAGQVRSALEQELGRAGVVEQWRDLVGSQGPSVRAEGLLRQKTQAILAAVKTNSAAQLTAKELPTVMKAAAPTASAADEQAALVALAAWAWLNGDAPQAEDRLKDAFAFRLAPKAVEVSEPPRWIEAWQRAQFAVTDRARGTLSVRTEPAGARVLLDGAVEGTSPLTVRDVVQGPHLLQVDLFGYELRGQLITLAGGEGEQVVRLAPEARIDEHEFRQAVLASVLTGNGEDLAATGKMLGIDAFLVGWLAHGKAGDALTLASVRVHDGAVLAIRKLPLEDLSDAQASALAASVATALMQGKSTTPAAKVQSEGGPHSHNPLDRVDGTEEW